MFKDLYDPNTPYMGDFVNLILRKMPIMHQWDDHDSGQNNVDKTYPDWNLTQQAFQEYMPSYPLPFGHAADLAEIQLCPGRLFCARLPQPARSRKRSRRREQEHARWQQSWRRPENYNG